VEGGCTRKLGKEEIRQEIRPTMTFFPCSLDTLLIYFPQIFETIDIIRAVEGIVPV
jgi:hypothetical protein